MIKFGKLWWLWNWKHATLTEECSPQTKKLKSFSFLYCVFSKKYLFIYQIDHKCRSPANRLGFLILQIRNSTHFQAEKSWQTFSLAMIYYSHSKKTISKMRHLSLFLSLNCSLKKQLVLNLYYNHSGMGCVLRMIQQHNSPPNLTKNRQTDCHMTNTNAFKTRSFIHIVNYAFNPTYYHEKQRTINWNPFKNLFACHDTLDP